MNQFMRNIFTKILVAGFLFGVVQKCNATDVAYTGIFQGVEGAAKVIGQTQNATYTRDMNTTGNLVSIQVVSSTYSPTTQTFTDGSQSTATITVSSNSYIFNSTPTLTVNGIKILYTPQSTSTGTAQSISNYMMSNSALSAVLNSTWTAGGVVTSTSILSGAIYNYTITSSSPAALTPVGYTGGITPAYLLNTPTITITNNGFTTGLEVSLSTSSGVGIGGLTYGASYYISIVNPNTLGQSSTFKLATTSTGAVAGLGVVLTSSQTKVGADTFSLIPSLTGFTNTSGGGFQLQYSDDDATFFNITTGNYNATISSQTFVSGGASSLWDLGVLSHRYIRLKETAPTTGAITYTVTDNERYNGGIH